MKLKKLFMFVLVSFAFFLGGIDCMAKTGHGYDEKRLAEFGWVEKDGAYINKYTKTEYDSYGFDRFGIHKDTKTRLDKNHFDWDGYYKKGVWDFYVAKSRLSDKGYSHRGFNKDGSKNIYTGTKYDKKGLDVRRFNKEGIHAHTRTNYDRKDRHGRDVNGLDKKGWTEEELRKKQAGAL